MFFLLIEQSIDKPDYGCLVDSDGDQQSFGTSASILTDLEVDGIGHEKRMLIVQWAVSEGVLNWIQSLTQAGDHGF
jgi:hypothetical protein